MILREISMTGLYFPSNFWTGENSGFGYFSEFVRVPAFFGPHWDLALIENCGSSYIPLETEEFILKTDSQFLKRKS